MRYVKKAVEFAGRIVRSVFGLPLLIAVAGLYIAAIVATLFVPLAAVVPLMVVRGAAYLAGMACSSAYSFFRAVEDLARNYANWFTRWGNATFDNLLIPLDWIDGHLKGSTPPPETEHSTDETPGPPALCPPSADPGAGI